MMKTQTIGVRLEEEMRQRLKDLGKVRNRSAHFLMKEAIMRYLTEEERYELERAEDEARWQRYLESGECLSQETMKDWLQQKAAEARSRQKK